MSQDCNDLPFIIAPTEGRLSEHERARLQEQLNKHPRGSLFVADQAMTIAYAIPPTLWVVGQNRDDTGEKWEIQGVFDSVEKALAACVKPTYWMAPIILNQPLPDETTDGWPGLHYPPQANS